MMTQYCSKKKVHKKKPLSNLVVRHRERDARKEITGYAIEQRNIMREELGLIHILDGP